ncbi:MAG: UbiA family prenyltransferase [Leptotrichia wadei]|uniref:UbiA family prenyltransferase n=1 Tax=Leptotrichia wadei TaxID=157687 RepID=UPI0026EC828E|nr:UbiA family prenyltransferase [Leptotrichia wadei]MBS6018934.1 UbiA family prenyltransferase [Leptotrichia wadei]
MNQSNINSKKSIIQNIKNFKIYLNERFPLGKNSIFVLIFTLSGYIFTGLLYNSKIINQIFSKEIKVPMPWHKIVALFIIIFMFFLQLRITDEFKDYEEDLKYRAYRPVQRGVITLKALGKIGIATVIIQIILAYIIDFKIIYFMIIVWFYMFLMAKEFFIKEWLTKRILIYALSHVVIMIFITLVIVNATQYIVLGEAENIIKFGALQWYRHNIDIALIPLFTLNYLNGIVLEIGRKTRRADEEEHGVQTYSKLWGKKKAVVILSLLFAVEYFLVILGLSYTYEKYLLLSRLVLLIILIISIYFMIKFLKKDLSGKIVESVSGLWIVFSSMGMGLLPYFVFSLIK